MQRRIAKRETFSRHYELPRGLFDNLRKRRPELGLKAWFRQQGGWRFAPSRVARLQGKPVAAAIEHDISSASPRVDSGLGGSHGQVTRQPRP
jgi:hypothetical protein